MLGGSTVVTETSKPKDTENRLSEESSVERSPDAEDEDSSPPRPYCHGLRWTGCGRQKS
ncbi:hypothetical protein BaRGS_00012697, partial [Batillaria attramentaria]